jgi:hypothetical protein
MNRLPVSSFIHFPYRLGPGLAGMREFRAAASLFFIF